MSGEDAAPGHLPPTVASALELFARALGRTPDAPLVTFFDRAFSYAEVDVLSEGIADHWFGVGIQRGDRIAVQLQNVPQYLLAVIAAWKMAAVVVPLNPMYRREEVGKALRDSGASALVCSLDNWADVIEPALPGTAIRSVLTTNEWELQGRNDARVLKGTAVVTAATAGLPVDPPCVDLLRVARTAHAVAREARPLRPDEIAFLCYTSGTSGVPKGAMITHANVVSNTMAIRLWSGLEDGTRIFGLAPLCHVTGLIFQLALALELAGSLVLTYRFQPDVVLDALREHRPQFMTGSPTAYTALLSAPSAVPEDFESFRLLATGGAALPGAVLDRFAERFRRYVHNGYGLTETTGPCVSVPVGETAPEDVENGIVSSGRAFLGTTLHIVGDDGVEMVDGSLGEVVIEGPGVVPGYWNQPEETAETIPGGRLFSGDLGRLEDGWLYVLDRKKDMINASGFKVWPREVEDVLYRHPSVREAAVVGVPDAYRGESVIAYVSLRDGAVFDEAGIIRFCRERLAAYKAPHGVRVLDELPKTTSGKILRRELAVAARS